MLLENSYIFFDEVSLNLFIILLGLSFLFFSVEAILYVLKMNPLLDKYSNL